MNQKFENNILEKINITVFWEIMNFILERYGETGHPIYNLWKNGSLNNEQLLRYFFREFVNWEDEGRER